MCAWWMSITSHLADTSAGGLLLPRGDFKPRDPKSLVAAVRARRQAKITDAEIAPMVDLVLVPDGRPVVTYLGYAVKDALPG